MTQPLQAAGAKPNGSLARAAVLTGSTGAGAMLLWLLIVALRGQPAIVMEMAAKILTTWGPLFALSVMVVWLADKRVGQMIAAHRDGAQAQQRMADAVQQIARRDDQRAREQELLLDHLNNVNAKIFDMLQQVRNEMLKKGASA